MRTHLDLFSGIGGFALAARWAGFETIQFVEIDAFCQQVLTKNFPGVPIHDDITTFSGSPLAGGVDLLTGGFPCQPFSVAGKQRGYDDSRNLWPEMARVVSEVRPRWVLGENTSGLKDLALDDCLTDLESVGYEAWAIAIAACAIGAWQRRERIWIIAHASPVQRVAIERSEPDGDIPRDPPPPPRTGSERLQERNGLQSRGPRTHPTTSTHSGWADEPPVGRVVHGLPGRVDRVRSLGNAIVPQVAYELIRLME